jgi:hypothetical protein
MWCEIRRHTLRHLPQGYWSAPKVERTSPKDRHLKNIFCVHTTKDGVNTKIELINR